MKRTLQQNKALHLFFTHLSEELNGAGYDMKKTLKEEIEIPWNETLVKEFLWKPIQKAVTRKESTRELEKEELDRVYEVLNRHLGEKLRIHVPFPSIETLTELENGQKIPREKI